MGSQAARCLVYFFVPQQKARRWVVITMSRERAKKRLEHPGRSHSTSKFDGTDANSLLHVGIVYAYCILIDRLMSVKPPTVNLNNKPTCSI